MLLNKYLIVGKKKYSKASARLTASAPSLESHEIAIKLSLDIPEALFTKPQLEAKITVDRKDVSSPVIEAEVIDNLQEVVSKELGLDLQISILSNGDD